MKTAYPQVMGTCDITLYANIPFDNSYQHHCLVSDRFKYNDIDIFHTYAGYTNPACERFIDRRDYKVASMPYVYKRWTLTGDYNFNFSNGLIASVTLELTPAQTNANYMKLVCGSDIYYYFITGISQVNFNTYNLSLELDVIMTYQDEFLDGMKDVPVFTQRKMSRRYDNQGIIPKCIDLKSGENIFSGVKPSYITDVVKTHFKNTQLKKVEGLYWAYICYDQTIVTAYGGDVHLPYKYKGISHPLLMACIPVNLKGILTLEDGTNHTAWTIDTDDISDVMEDVIGNGKVHAIKLSPYPPFGNDNAMTITKSGNNYTIVSTNISITGVGGGSELATWDNPKTKLRFIVGGDKHKLLIEEEKLEGYSVDNVQLPHIANVSAPTITSNRFNDPKLLFAPFKKYKISAPYGEGCEFYPELIYSVGYFTDTEIPLHTIASCYIGDYSFYTYVYDISDDNGEDIIGNYNYESVGLACNVNYILPAGTNALDVFNSTQANSFYQSKVASGITSGLTMAGGIASIVIGAVAEMPTAGASTAMIAGGVTALAQGSASMINTIKSTSAKIEDLKNTPDSVNVSGSSFISDLGKTNYMYPYVVVYDVSDEVKNKANDFFYQYGYQVGRDCYFNTELSFDNDVSYQSDNNLFNRTIFNYIQINEDITNKINANIPYIVKKKLSSVFNSGITLWTFFGFSQVYLIYPPQDYDPTYTYDIDKWFMKHKYDNTEYDGSDYY